MRKPQAIKTIIPIFLIRPFNPFYILRSLTLAAASLTP